MALQITIPGKSFIVGEYLAIGGGPSLVAALSPRFTLDATKVDKGSAQLIGIHPDSPAGKYYHAYQDDFSRYVLTFTDPHQGAGGWGASTAQFAALHAMRAWRESILIDAEKQMDIRDLLSEYQKLSYQGEGAAPSGADLVAQVRGGLSYFDRTKGQLKRHYWPFADLGLAFIRTGNKLQTHEHLKELKSFDSSALLPHVHDAQEALEMVDSELFLSAVEDFHEKLVGFGLEDERTTALVEEVRQQNFCLATKGCGAMGVDTLLVVYRQSEREGLETWVQKQGLSLVATEKNLESGIDLKIQPQVGKMNEFSNL